MKDEQVSAAVRAYAKQRARELLAERPFHVGELEILILEELRAGVRQGATDYTTPLLATGHLRPEANMRLKLQT